MSHESAIVRVYDGTGAAVAVGFLVAKRHVITCAHVVADALGIPRSTADRPAGDLEVDFPLLPDKKRRKAAVSQWVPMRSVAQAEIAGTDDTAVLILFDDPPADAQPIRLVACNGDVDCVGHECRVYGHPAGWEGGRWSEGLVMGPESNGWYQIDCKSNVEFQKGFSGGPVFDRAHLGCVGMFVAADQPNRVGHFIPTAMLVRAWPELGRHTVPPCPYRDLKPFFEQQAADYFGRDEQRAALLELIQKEPLVPIIGPSGSGKSSLAFAGFLPVVRARSDWCVADFRPGSDPFHALASALLPLLEPDRSETDRLVEARALAQSLRGRVIPLADVLRRIRVIRAAPRFLLLADQFEELYTPLRDPADRELFLDVVLDALEAEPGSVRHTTLLLTVRGDFTDHLLRTKRFADAFAKARDVKLVRMSDADLTRAVVEPARRAGVEVEPDLATRVISDTTKGRHALSLLQFTLTRLWETQENGRITLKQYGGIQAANLDFVRHANDVLGQMSEAQRNKAWRVLVQLVHPMQDEQYTRRRATRSEIGSDNWDLVGRLASARLVETDVVEGEPTVELISDVLVEGWQELRDNVKQDEAFLQWRERLRAHKRRWSANHGTDQPSIYGEELTEALQWLEKRPDELGEFVDMIRASAAARSFRRWSLTVLATIVAFVFGVVAVVGEYYRQRADHQSQVLATRTDQLERATYVSDMERLEQASQTNLTTYFELLDNYHPSRYPRADLLGPEWHYQWNSSRAAMPTLRGHGSAVTDVAYSADGRRAVTTSDDMTIRIWDATTGAQLRVIERDQGRRPVGGSGRLALSRDGKYVAARKDTFTLGVWRTDSGALVKESRRGGFISNLVFEASGRKLLVGASSGCWVWDLDTGRITDLGIGNDTPVNVISPDGQQVVSVDEGGMMRIIDLQSKKLVFTHQGRGAMPHAAVFSRDGELIAADDKDGSVRVLEARNGTVKSPSGGLKPPQGRRPTARAFSPHNDWLAIADEHGAVSFWDVRSGGLFFSIRASDASISQVDFSPDGRRVAVSCGDGAVRVFEVSSDRQPRTTVNLKKMIDPDEQVESLISISSDDETIACVYGDRSIRILNAQTGKERARLVGHRASVQAVVFSEDNGRPVSVSADGEVRIWDLAHAKTSTVVQLQLPDYGKTSWEFALTRDGGSVVGFGLSERKLAYAFGGWDATTGRQLVGNLISGAIEPSVITAVRVDNQGVRAAVATGIDGPIGNSTMVVDARTGKVVWHKNWREDAPIGMAFSNDGSELALGFDTRHLRICRAETGDIRLDLVTVDTTNAVCFSANGSRLVTGGGDNVVRIWETGTGKQLLAIRDHRGPVLSVAISPGTRCIASTSESKAGTLRIWDVSNHANP